MQRIYVFTAMTVVLSAAVLLAQSDSDYQGWMKSNAANICQSRDRRQHG